MNLTETDQLVLGILRKHRAIKLDFTSESFDYFKYNGKVNISPKALANKASYWSCVKISRLYPTDEAVQSLFVACMLHDKFWIGNCTDEESKIFMQKHDRLSQSIGYVFTSEIDNLFASSSTPFKNAAGEIPEVLKSLMSEKLSYHSASVLDKYIGFSNVLDNSLGKDHVVWNSHRLKIKRLHRYIPHNKDRIKETLNSLLIKLNKENV